MIVILQACHFAAGNGEVGSTNTFDDRNGMEKFGSSTESRLGTLHGPQSRFISVTLLKIYIDLKGTYL